MTTFTPLSSLIGGILIGISAVALMTCQGRVAGISGILSRLLPPYQDNETFGRAAFMLGLVLAPVSLKLMTGYAVAQTVSANLPVMVVAGLLVGFGTVLGNGCTERSWGVRHRTIFDALSRRDTRLHGGRFRDRLPRTPRAGRLAWPFSLN